MYLIGYHLIAWIKSWQSTINDIALSFGVVGFQFNMYIISVLVIFFLQMCYKFPQIKNLPVSKSKDITIPDIGSVRLKEALSDFFQFYALKYQVKNPLISVNVGRWQSIKMQDGQKFSSEQKRFVHVKTFRYWFLIYNFFSFICRTILVCTTVFLQIQ